MGINLKDFQGFRKEALQLSIDLKVCVGEMDAVMALDNATDGYKEQRLGSLLRKYLPEE